MGPPSAIPKAESGVNISVELKGATKVVLLKVSTETNAVIRDRLIVR